VGVRARSAGLSKSGNPGSASLRSGNDLNLPRVVADQKMSRWSANETEDAMKRTILIAAALLASALSANAAPVKKHQRVVHGRACHETVLTGDDAVRYALGIFNGTAPFPRLECYPVARAGGSRQAPPSYDPGPSPDSPPPPSGPDMSGMNTSTNPTWGPL
jgi:hypothetical protein